MKKSISIFLSKISTLVIAVTILSACNKTPKHLKYIPKDAIFITGIDGKSIALKTVDFKKILNFDFLNNKEVKNDSLADLLKSSGIDLLGKAFVFVNPNKDDKNSFQVGAIVALDNAQDFANFMAKEAKKYGYKFTDKGDIHYFEHKSGTAMAWNNEVLIMGIMVSQNGILSGKAIVQNYMATKEENSILKNEKFVELQKKDADLSLWFNYEFMDSYKEITQQYETYLGKGFNFKDTYISATLNFEDGAIKSEMNSYSNEFTQKKFGKLINQNINAAVVNKHPGKDLNGYLGFAINLKEVEKLLKEMKLLAIVDMSLAQTGFTSADAFAAFSGDIIFSINGVSKQDQPSYNYETGAVEMKKMTVPTFGFSLGIGEKAKFDKIITYLETKALIQKTGDKAYTAMGKAFFAINDKSMIGVSAAELGTALTQNKYEFLSDADKKLFEKNAMVFNLNFTKIDTSFINQLGATALKTYAEQPVESIIFTSTAMKDGKSTGLFEVNFKNKKQNSLITLYEAVKKAKDLIPNPLAPNPQMYEEDAAALGIDTAVSTAEESKSNQ